MNADLWTQRISQNASPAYPCPHCQASVLILQKESFVRHATVASREQQPDEGFVPDLMVYSFACWLKCAAPRCGEMVAVIGEGHEEPTFDAEHGMDWEE